VYALYVPAPFPWGRRFPAHPPQADPVWSGPTGRNASP
jgi:hypothetical protein